MKILWKMFTQKQSKSKLLEFFEWCVDMVKKADDIENFEIHIGNDNAKWEYVYVFRQNIEHWERKWVGWMLFMNELK